jgi:Fe-S-cluster containining protein
VTRYAHGVDRDLVQIVDAAMAEAVRKSGSWIACKPGCAECCIGPFPITMLDAERLREGLATLAQTDPGRATRVHRRVAESVALLPEFPGNDDAVEEWIESLPEEEPCPVLDPETGTCDLYAARPITCRIFGPAVRAGGDAVGVCDLCYHGATEEQIAACQVEVDPGDLEGMLLAGDTRKTIVALALFNVVPAASRLP